MKRNPIVSRRHLIGPRLVLSEKQTRDGGQERTEERKMTAEAKIAEKVGTENGQSRGQIELKVIKREENTLAQRDGTSSVRKRRLGS